MSLILIPPRCKGIIAIFSTFLYNFWAVVPSILALFFPQPAFAQGESFPPEPLTAYPPKEFYALFEDILTEKTPQNIDKPPFFTHALVSPSEIVARPSVLPCLVRLPLVHLLVKTASPSWICPVQQDNGWILTSELGFKIGPNFKNPWIPAGFGMNGSANSNRVSNQQLWESSLTASIQAWIPLSPISSLDFSAKIEGLSGQHKKLPKAMSLNTSWQYNTKAWLTFLDSGLELGYLWKPKNSPFAFRVGLESSLPSALRNQKPLSETKFTDRASYIFSLRSQKTEFIYGFDFNYLSLRLGTQHIHLIYPSTTLIFLLH